MSPSYNRVLEFWFEELSPSDWWRKNEQLDARIREEFSAVHESVSEGATEDWRRNDRGRLAEIIVLDQFSRNMFRNQARAFGYDALAREKAREAVKCMLELEEEFFSKMTLNGKESYPKTPTRTMERELPRKPERDMKGC